MRYTNRRGSAVLTFAMLAVMVVVVSGCEAASPPEGINVRDESRALAETSVPGSIGRANEVARPPGLPPAQNTPDVAAPAVAGAPAATQPAAREPRQVIYSAGYRVVVADVPGTLRALREAADRLGGYLQEVSGASITVRVPAERFDDAVRVVESAGEVVDRQLKAQDVTEEMRDLGIRLDNAERLRQHLLAILAKAEKVEDTMKVEAELARVSSELDTIKGKIRFMQSQIAMATIRVELNAPAAQNARGTGARLPFVWVEALGDGLVAGEVQQATRQAGFLASGPRFRPPAGFVRYYEEKSQTEAMNGAGLLLRVQRHENVDAAPVEFWGKLARRSVVDGRAVAVTKEEQTPSYYLLTGTRDVGGKQLGYLLSIKRSAHGVAVFEAWGPRELFDAQSGALRNSALSADPD